MTSRSWTTASEVEARVETLWRRGEILREVMTGEPRFPLEIRLKRPSARDIAERFGDVQDWVRDLTGVEKRARGFGFELRWQSIRNRVQGTNKLPVTAVIPTVEDALRLVRRERDAARFRELAEGTLERHPALQSWLTRRPLRVVENTEIWDRVLDVLDCFVSRPRPGVYPRQLDISGVDTKFIERQRRLLAELLDEILPEAAVDRSATGARGFNQRYGLRDEPPLVRFRLLDEDLYIEGLSDLSLPPDPFAALSLPVRRVFITENRTNGLAFPDSPGGMVIFGLGYGLDRLSEASWLRDVDVRYWGDIDTHGFGILNRLRRSLPNALSFLMDRETLLAHRAVWGQEPEDSRYAGAVSLLTPDERALLKELQSDSLGARVRLEQERIGYRWLRRALEDMDGRQKVE